MWTTHGDIWATFTNGWIRKKKVPCLPFSSLIKLVCTSKYRSFSFYLWVQQISLFGWLEDYSMRPQAYQGYVLHSFFGWPRVSHKNETPECPKTNGIALHIDLGSTYPYSSAFRCCGRNYLTEVFHLESWKGFAEGKWCVEYGYIGKSCVNWFKPSIGFST